MKVKLAVDVCALSCTGSRFTYRACPTCVRKVFPVRNSSSANLFWCASCKVQLEEDETNFCYYLTLQVTDGNSVAMATIFGPSLEVVFRMPARVCHEWSTEGRCPPLQSTVNQRVVNRWLRLYFCVYSPQCLVGGRGRGRKACLRDVTEEVGSSRLVAYWLVPIDPTNRFGEGGEWSQVGECCPFHQPIEEADLLCQSDVTKEHSTHGGSTPKGGLWAGPGYSDTSWQCSQDEAKLAFLDSLSAVLSESCEEPRGGATAEGVCAQTSPAPTTTVSPRSRCSSPPTEGVCKLEQQGSSSAPGDSVVQYFQDGLLRTTAAMGDPPNCVPCDAEDWLSVVEECALTESILEVLSEPWDTTLISQGGGGGKWKEVAELMENVSVSDSEWLQPKKSHPISSGGGSQGRDYRSDLHCQPPLLPGGPATPTTTRPHPLAVHITTRPHPPATPTTFRPRMDSLLGNIVVDTDCCHKGDSPLLFSPTPKAAKCLVTAPPTSAAPLCQSHRFLTQQTLFNTRLHQDCNTPMNGCATSSYVTAVADTPLSNVSQFDHVGMEWSPDLFAPSPPLPPAPTTPDLFAPSPPLPPAPTTPDLFAPSPPLPPSPTTPNTNTWMHALDQSWVSPNIL